MNNAKKLNIGIIVAPYYQHITNGLLNGAKNFFKNEMPYGYIFEQFDVTGALEAPLAAQMLAATEQYDVLVALGAVIRGETAHFDHVCTQSAHGLMEVSLKYNIPIGNGILTVENEDQAIARSADSEKNKGREAAMAAISLQKLKFQLQE
ncbi:6,7-dimethyl-8-ribityllumazine synthase [Marinicella sp. W31]|uniref:6,7-dimethyl-8-ribityllumazine synthase n=1 Tax=Marinicella sp. W31 TaxID=3023713 RepID=UPI003757094D